MMDPRRRKLLERALGDLARRLPREMSPLAKEAWNRGGKRLRPLLHLSLARAWGVTTPASWSVALALEGMHTASLLHDDVMDGARRRRGHPVFYRVHGSRTAVLTGDFLLSVALAPVVEEENHDLNRVMVGLPWALSLGEYLQPRWPPPSGAVSLPRLEKQYYRSIDLKTARLFSAASETAAILAGFSRPLRRRAAAFGRELGLAFQLRDDLRDYGLEGRQRKTLGQDFRNRFLTLPLLCLVRETGCSWKALQRISWREAARRMREAGVPFLVEKKRVGHLVRARRYLGGLPGFGQGDPSRSGRRWSELEGLGIFLPAR